MDDILKGPVVWRPDATRIAQSNLGRFMAAQGIADYAELLKRADQDPDWWWGQMMERVVLRKPWERVVDLSRGIEFPVWGVGARLNLVDSCLERHRATPVWLQTALIGENDAGDLREWSYAELSAQSAHLAAGLVELGVQPGEVVALYMPNVNEAIAGMLAIARIGAVAMPLFSGFGVDAIISRMEHGEAVAVLTVDGTLRRGRHTPMKQQMIEAARQLPHLRNIVVLAYTGQSDAPRSPLEVDWTTLCADRPDDFDNIEMDAEAPVMLIYTSGTSGKPKGTVHSHLGLATKFNMDIALFLDFGPTDVVIWPSDMGWLIGPMLSFGVTQAGSAIVLTDGAPNAPEPDRIWRQVEQYRATILGFSPTVVRGFMNTVGTGGRDTTSLRLCTSSGEAWTPDAWWWTFREVLHSRHPILNYSGGTEIGGAILSGNVVTPLKPCSFSAEMPGMGVDIVDMEGKSVGRDVLGELVLRKTSIGLSRSLWRDDERYLDSYWRDIPGVWRQGDLAMQDSDGLWFIVGRSDDTLKIAGKRTGPAEIEAILTAGGLVAEASVIGIPDPVKGEGVGCIVILSTAGLADPDVAAKISQDVVRGLGHPYRPALVLAVPDLPRTRNMKIMRRLVKAAVLGRAVGDTSSLVNPDALGQIRAAAKAADVAHG